MKKLFQFILLTILSGVLMTSCYYDTEYEYVDIVVEDVSYAADIMPLWNADCVGCHSGNEPPDMRDDVSWDELLNGYVIPGNAENSILYKSLLGIDGVSLMPPGTQWPTNKINLVRDWINQGALDN